MKKRMFKRAQTFLFVLRRKLTKALHNGGHRATAAAAVAAAVAAVRLRLMLGLALLTPDISRRRPPSSSSLTRRRYLLQNDGVSRSSPNIHGYCIT
jgi:hypothetical protein